MTATARPGLKIRRQAKLAFALEPPGVFVAGRARVLVVARPEREI